MLMRTDPLFDVDRLAQGAFRLAAGPGPAFDAIKSGDTVVLQFDLPGVAPESIDVAVDNRVLTVSAERLWAPAEGEQVLVAGRQHGAWRRQVQLGDHLDTARLEASYEHGVLTLTVPIAERAKSRKVPVTVGRSARTTEALPTPDDASALLDA